MHKLNKFNNGLVKFPRMMEMMKECNVSFKCKRFIAQPNIQQRLCYSADPFESRVFSPSNRGRFRPSYNSVKLKLWDRKHK